jgi:hypothetical protein
MKTQTVSEKNKKNYTEPAMERIRLDKDISLTMSSFEPPFGPSEASFLISDAPLSDFNASF